MKARNLALTTLFVVLVFGFAIAFWLLPDKDFSEDENRVLTPRPALSAAAWTDGSLSRSLTDYYADQFPLRSMWVGLHAVGELALGKRESNGVLLGADGQLAVRRHDMYIDRTARAENTDLYRASAVEAGLDALVRLNDTLQADGRDLCVLLPPRTVDVTTDLSYPSAVSDTLDAAIRARLSDINHVDLLSAFRARYAAGEYVYFRTDHHWTMRGAYAAYTAVMDSLGLSEGTLPESFYTLRAVPDFYGTTHARSGLYFIPPDTLELYEAADGSDARYTVRDAQGTPVVESGFVSEKYLSTKDKYGALLDGTHRLLTVTDTAAPADSRPRLLLAKDSFGAAMVPFLARHFDIVAVNLSGGMTDLSALAETYDCALVLVVCNRENLITSDCLAQVK